MLFTSRLVSLSRNIWTADKLDLFFKYYNTMDDRELDLTEAQKVVKAKYPPINKKYECESSLWRTCVYFLTPKSN